MIPSPAAGSAIDTSAVHDLVTTKSRATSVVTCGVSGGMNAPAVDCGTAPTPEARSTFGLMLAPASLAVPVPVTSGARTWLGPWAVGSGAVPVPEHSPADAPTFATESFAWPVPDVRPADTFVADSRT